MDEPVTELVRPCFSFITPGNQVEQKDSYMIINQGYVHFISPTTPLSFPDEAHPQRPLLFLHGGGLTSTVYTTPLHHSTQTWATLSADSGRPTYLLDFPDSGHSQRPPSKFRTLEEGFGPLEHRTAAEAWSMFRLGPAEGLASRKTWERSKFPGEAFDDLVAMQAARRRGPGVDDLEARAVIDAVNRIGECDVLAHSHGAVVLLIALKMMDEMNDDSKVLVRDVVLVEPGPTGDGDMLKQSSSIGRTLVIWGDLVDKFPGSVAAWDRVKSGYKSNTAEELVLPQLGIMGNSHVMMLDTNAAQIMDIILQWLDNHTIQGAPCLDVGKKIPQ
ncbi:hypothetical protein P152DRAFT_514128 [Eremomyces bilateralis CBS 781.70]|uniref:AB hydrolase-1 domain-containing protein n=1 Tax=Eremomyces bilateralis CBS 781.70 TaxID=1392243 RepID=A0A6G1G2Z8_9PEZI|nr:uncharacterized protein P152DRAFT_514128 [Eremomyces bilateralis CBS 781.70]KAF1812485.1 hypothetical protein P152DRAFT_514128 [Eremomyces bilateralis CBS 781.70]